MCAFKIIEFILDRAYSTLFHFILGVVFASTVMIIQQIIRINWIGILLCVVF